MIPIQGQWESRGSNIKTELSSQRKNDMNIQVLSDSLLDFILSIAIGFLASVSKDISTIMAL